MRAVARYIYLKVATAGFVVAFLTACAGGITGYQTNVDKVEQTYIEAETNLKNAFNAMSALSDKEIAARAQGKPAGSVITKDRYDASMARLGQLKALMRTGRDLVGQACVPLEKSDGTRIYPSLDLSGCLNRESVALTVLMIVQKINEGSL